MVIFVLMYLFSVRRCDVKMANRDAHVKRQFTYFYPGGENNFYKSHLNRKNSKLPVLALLFIMSEICKELQKPQSVSFMRLDLHSCS